MILQQQEAGREGVGLAIKTVVELQLLVLLHIHHRLAVWIVCAGGGIVVRQIPGLETSVVHVVALAVVAGEVVAVHHHLDAGVRLRARSVGVDVGRGLGQLVFPVVVRHVLGLDGLCRCAVGCAACHPGQCAGGCHVYGLHVCHGALCQRVVEQTVAVARHVGIHHRGGNGALAGERGSACHLETVYHAPLICAGVADGEAGYLAAAVLLDDTLALGEQVAYLCLDVLL